MPQNPVTQREMAPMKEVFGNERNTPSKLFENSRAENADATASLPTNDMALECPLCAQTAEPGVRLFAGPSGYGCLKGHLWKDLDELMSMNPRKLEFKGRPARQEGWEKLTLEMPGSVLLDLQRKFGDRLGATIRALLESVTASKYVMVGDEHLKKLVEYLGQEIPNAATLMGLVYSLKRTADDLKAEVDAARGNRPAGATTVTTLAVELGSLHEQVVARAESQQWAPSELVRYCVETCFKNDWA